MTEPLEPFFIVPGKAPKLPIVLSVPHCGTEFPAEVKGEYRADLISSPEDTDWFVHRLYDFAPEMGITLIYARYSRWLIDINRDSQSKPLYNDGRLITELVPSKTFLGEDLYRKSPPKEEEIARRLEHYYWPYYKKVESLLFKLKEEFSHVLFYDAHSIKQNVPTIHPDPFSDLILGNQDEKTADSKLIACAVENLQSSSYSFVHNGLFKGGQLTRYFGQPEKGIHALQLEMTKINYMNEETTSYDEDKAQKMQVVLRQTLQALGKTLQTL